VIFRKLEKEQIKFKVKTYKNNNKE
jgi:hypothetical protein